MSVCFNDGVLGHDGIGHVGPGLDHRAGHEDGILHPGALLHHNGVEEDRVFHGAVDLAAAGDQGVGNFRSLSHASASGVYVARRIIDEEE